jgi:hypothetical protein
MERSAPLGSPKAADMTTPEYSTGVVVVSALRASQQAAQIGAGPAAGALAPGDGEVLEVFSGYHDDPDRRVI